MSGRLIATERTNSLISHIQNKQCSVGKIAPAICPRVLPPIARVGKPFRALPTLPKLLIPFTPKKVIPVLKTCRIIVGILAR